jgi:hypothetical protein
MVLFRQAQPKKCIHFYGVAAASLGCVNGRRLRLSFLTEPAVVRRFPVTDKANERAFSRVAGLLKKEEVHGRLLA